jgi:hypothetical protein
MVAALAVRQGVGRIDVAGDVIVDHGAPVWASELDAGGHCGLLVGPDAGGMPGPVGLIVGWC